MTNMKNFVNAHLEAAAGCIQTKQRAKSRIPMGDISDKKKVCRRQNRFQMQQEEPNQYQCPETYKRHKIN